MKHQFTIILLAILVLVFLYFLSSSLSLLLEWIGIHPGLQVLAVFAVVIVVLMYLRSRL